MNSLQKFNKFGHTINVYGTIDKPLFKASEIGKALELTNVHASVALIDDKFKVLNTVDTRGGVQKTTFLTEPGLYQLIFKSRKQEAVEFQMWIYEDVLPTIRKTGKYEIEPPEYHERLTFKIETEKDLQQKVVNFIRNTFPQALILASLGELQDNIQKRIECKKSGYEKGTPDIIINNLHKRYNGFAIEFKSPTGEGVLSASQSAMIEKYKQNNYKVMVSNNYDLILMSIIEYFHNVRIACPHCDGKFKNNSTLKNHKKYFHKILA